MFSLPTRFGGMGVRDRVLMSVRSFEASRSGVNEIVSYMRDGGQFSIRGSSVQV